jgi:hypothetical protein
MIALSVRDVNVGLPAIVSTKCPFCGSLIYSRRNILCGVCGQRLPHDLLFSGRERETVERELNEAKRRLHQASEDRRTREVWGAH